MATKKTSAKNTLAKKTSAKKRMQVSGKTQNQFDPGTVGWLIEQLQKFPRDMYVLHGDQDSTYYQGDVVEVLPIHEGYIDQDHGENVVCITAY